MLPPLLLLLVLLKLNEAEVGESICVRLSIPLLSDCAKERRFWSLGVVIGETTDVLDGIDDEDAAVAIAIPVSTTITAAAPVAVAVAAAAG